ncbi:MAG: hypothetical protein IJY19_07635 [Ruminococcus sp.]|nr:hypothetical protein [Ruminococcus sp.]
MKFNITYQQIGDGLLFVYLLLLFFRYLGELKIALTDFFIENTYTVII